MFSKIKLSSTSIHSWSNLYTKHAQRYMSITKAWVCVTKAKAWSWLYKDHSGYGLGQWATTLHCNVLTHWPSPYPERPLLWNASGALPPPLHTCKVVNVIFFEELIEQGENLPHALGDHRARQAVHQRQQFFIELWNTRQNTLDQLDRIEKCHGFPDASNKAVYQMHLHFSSNPLNCLKSGLPIARQCWASKIASRAS